MARREGSVSRMPERRSERDVPVHGGVGSLRSEMNRLFDRFTGRGGPPATGRRSSDLFGLDPWARDPFELLESAFGGSAESFGRADLSETDRSYELQVDLPGLTRDDVEIEYSNGALMVSGERRDEREDERKGYYISERTYGGFRRVFRVPESVDHDKIEAHFNDGVLTVELPKTEQAQQSSRRIEVKESGGKESRQGGKPSKSGESGESRESQPG